MTINQILTEDIKNSELWLFSWKGRIHLQKRSQKEDWIN